MSIEQDLNCQIDNFDKQEGEAPSQDNLRAGKDLGLLFSPRNIINGMQLMMPDIFKGRAREGLEILDIGCGNGADTVLLLRLAGFPGAQGIDLSTNRIQTGKNIASSLGVDPACLQKKSIQDLISEARTFDIVIGQCILHHFLKYASFLEAVHSILKPSGRFIFYEPACHPMRAFESCYDWSSGEVIQRSLCKELFLNPFRLSKRIKAAGFKNIDIFSNFYNYKLTAALKKVPLVKYFGVSIFLYAQKPAADNG